MARKSPQHQIFLRVGVPFCLFMFGGLHGLTNVSIKWIVSRMNEL